MHRKKGESIKVCVCVCVWGGGGGGVMSYFMGMQRLRPVIDISQVVANLLGGHRS